MDGKVIVALWASPWCVSSRVLLLSSNNLQHGFISSHCLILRGHKPERLGTTGQTECYYQCLMLLQIRQRSIFFSTSCSLLLLVILLSVWSYQRCVSAVCGVVTNMVCAGHTLSQSVINKCTDLGMNNLESLVALLGTCRGGCCWINSHKESGSHLLSRSTAKGPSHQKLMSYLDHAVSSAPLLRKHCWTREKRAPARVCFMWFMCLL